MKTSNKYIGSLLVAGLATISLEAYATNTSSTPFDIKPLDRGYQVAAAGEGSCGQDKMKESNCGGSQSDSKKMDNEAVCGLYKIGSAHENDSKVEDGKCGGHKVVESLCGGG